MASRTQIQRHTHITSPSTCSANITTNISPAHETLIFPTASRTYRYDVSTPALPEDFSKILAPVTQPASLRCHFPIAKR